MTTQQPLPVDGNDLERLWHHWERSLWQDQLDHALIEALDGRLQRDATPLLQSGGDMISVSLPVSRDPKGYIVDADAQAVIHQFLARFLDYLSARPGVVVWWMRPEFGGPGKALNGTIQTMVSVDAA